MHRYSPQTVLNLAAAGIGSLYQNKETLLLLPADFHKRLHAIRAEIRIDRGKILIKAAAHIVSNLHLTQMSYRVCIGGGSDIAALDVADHHQPFFFTVIHRLLERRKPRYAELLIHGDLRLDCRDQVEGMIHDLLIKLPDRLRCPF